LKESRHITKLKEAMMFKVGVVGCGGIGMTHARTWNSLEGVQVSAVVDTNLEKAVAAAEACKCPYYSSVDELPEDWMQSVS
jgi:predicted dehydrogenase